MKLEQLNTFVCVARLGSFTLAAEQLNTTQSTVSMRIVELEKSLDARLFGRSTRGVTITTKGRELLAYAESIGRLVDEARAVVGDPAHLSGRIRIGVAELIALTCLPEVMAAFQTIYPNVQVDLEIGLTGTVMNRLNATNLQLGVVGMEPPADPGLVTVPVGSMEFAFLASPDLPIAEGQFSPDILQEYAVLNLGAGSYVAEAQAAWFRANNVRPSRQSSCNSMLISARLARSGFGVAFLPVGYFKEELESGALRRLDIQPSPPPIDFYAVHRAEDESPPISSLIASIRAQWPSTP
ncbi:LysR family transcriptional regulator [Roseovarius sp. MBR-6]|jgi:DNA-binding transcriptional LysR family regulator|uniref:LysR family transcriptional regulator n=1 Tax=Roseovarius sp. MBR-6 TaxID=3156459 RepID=UPI003390E4B7